MAYYTALINAVNSTTQPPTGVTGLAITAGMTPDQKLTVINGWTVPKGSPNKALLNPSDIINAVIPADLAALTSAQVGMFTLILQGDAVDASQGTTIRAAAQTLFSGKATTLANLAALVAPFDNPKLPWWQANGYPAIINGQDLKNAGLA